MDGKGLESPKSRKNPTPLTRKKSPLTSKPTSSYATRSLEANSALSLHSPPLDLPIIKRRGSGYAKSPKLRPKLSNSKGSFINAAEKLKRSFSLTSSSLRCKKEGLSHFSSLYVKDLLEDGGEFLPIRCVKEGDKLAEIVESLSRWRKSITAVQNEDGKLIGIIDVMDLLQICYQRIKSSPNYECSSLECRESFLLEDAKSFLSNGVGSKIVPLSSNAPIYELISLLSLPDTKNVVILKEGITEAQSCDDIAAILTHTDLIRFVLEHPHIFPQLQIKVGECISSVLSEKEEKEEVENRMKEDLLVVSSFKTIWNKQTLGGVYCHGHSFLDKFMNWLVQIMMADLPVEEITLDPSQTLQELVKVMFQKSVSRVLIVDEQQRTMGYADIRNSISKLKDLCINLNGKSKELMPSPQPVERSL